MTTMTMYCVVSRAALVAAGGNRGKMLAQAGHAFLHAYIDATDRFPAAAEAYRSSDAPRKIVLVDDGDNSLAVLEAAYRDVCGIYLVRDAGHTVFRGSTVTCLGIGPLADDQVSEDLRILAALR